MRTSTHSHYSWVMNSQMLTYRVWLTLGLAVLGSSQWKWPLPSVLLNLRQRRTEPLNCQLLITSFAAWFARNPLFPLHQILFYSHLESTNHHEPYVVYHNSLRSVTHCNALSLGLVLEGIVLPLLSMSKTSSRSTKLSLGMVALRNIRETPAACVRKRSKSIASYQPFSPIIAI